MSLLLPYALRQSISSSTKYYFESVVKPVFNSLQVQLHTVGVFNLATIQTQAWHLISFFSVQQVDQRFLCAYPNN